MKKLFRSSLLLLSALCFFSCSEKGTQSTDGQREFADYVDTRIGAEAWKGKSTLSTPEEPKGPNMGLVLLVILAVIAAIAGYFKKEIKELWNSDELVEIRTALKEAVKPAVDKIDAFLEKTKIKAFFAKVGEKLAPVWAKVKPVFVKIGEILGLVWTKVKDLAKVLCEKVKVVAKKLAETVKIKVAEMKAASKAKKEAKFAAQVAAVEKQLAEKYAAKEVSENETEN